MILLRYTHFGRRSSSGNGEALDRGCDFVARVGLVSQQFSTGGRTILGRITNRGSRYLKMMAPFKSIRPLGQYRLDASGCFRATRQPLCCTAASRLSALRDGPGRGLAASATNVRSCVVGTLACRAAVRLLPAEPN